MTGMGEDVYIDHKANREAVLDELVAESQRLGLYGDAPDVEKMVEGAATAISEATRNNFREMLGKPVGSRNIVDPARAALESLGIPLSVLAAIRAGEWVAVPVRETDNMALRGGDSIAENEQRGETWQAKYCWSHMLSAAPKTPEEAL